MGAMEIAKLLMGGVGTALQMAHNLHLIGHPDWEKYLTAGLAVAQDAVPILDELIVNPGKYDKMSPAEIKALLLPATWEEILAAGKAKLAASK